MDPIPLEEFGISIVPRYRHTRGHREYPEKNLAHELHRHLTRRFNDTAPQTLLSVDGDGVHWHCTAERGDSFCSIVCFDLGAPQYYTSFQRLSQKLATGRTSSREDTLAAVDDWLQGCEVSFLHDRFRFVDQIKRALSGIRETVIARVPQLRQSATCELQHAIADIYCLWFRSGDRSCRISHDRANEFSYAVFHWDECGLFSFRVDDNEQLADVLKRWLCDRAMPSTMRVEFPWLSIGDLADYYEEGRPVEGEFMRSWDIMQQFYEDDSFPMKVAVLELIAQLRHAGYDRTLRAGQSLWTLIVSRSRRHGLRANQPCISFSFREGVMDVRVFVRERDEAEEIRGITIALSAPLQAALSQLAEQPVD